MKKDKTISDNSFLGFILQNRINIKYLILAVSGTIIQFIVFKFLYPFPDFFSDSYSYIYAAYANLDINIWPIGYSKFLALFHDLTHSDTALVGFQYFFLELTALNFFFSILYFFRPARNTSLILFLFLFCNPLLLYFSNLVNSDSLFAALSLWWFTELIWIIHRPRINQVFIQAILLFLAFTVRHNAVYYPIIAIVAFVLSRQRLWIKVSAGLVGFVLIVPFIIHERNIAYKMYGIKEFSPMGGWLLANNALYIYGNVKVDSNALPSPQAKELDRMVRQFYKHTTPQFHTFLSEHSGSFFLHTMNSPLKLYVQKHYKITDDYSNIIAWGKASAPFEEYGKYLIGNNLAVYLEEYVLLNVKKYFLPPVDKMEVYNMGMDQVWPIVKYWFHYKTTKVTAVSKNAQGIILFIYPPLFLLLNLYMIWSGIWWWIRKKYNQSEPDFNRTLLMTASFLIVNFGFWVVITIIVLRYEVLPMIIGVTFSLLIMDWLDRKEIQSNLKSNSQEAIKTMSLYKSY